MSTLGRWLQPPPKGSLEQQYQELVNLLRTKERLLETTSHDLKVKTAAMQILEQKIMSSESTATSIQRELNARTEQMKALETELAARSSRVAAMEAEATVETMINTIHAHPTTYEALGEAFEDLPRLAGQLSGILAEGLVEVAEVRRR